MRTKLTLGLFGFGLVVLFALSFGVGRLVGPERTPGSDPAPTGKATPTASHTGGGHA